MVKQFEYCLQLVPFKEPRTDTTKVISSDPKIAGFDDYRYVFTDIGVDSSNRVCIFGAGAIDKWAINNNYGVINNLSNYLLSCLFTPDYLLSIYLLFQRRIFHQSIVYFLGSYSCNP